MKDHIHARRIQDSMFDRSWKKVKKISDDLRFRLVIRFTCTSNAGVASVKHKVEGRLSSARTPGAGAEYSIPLPWTVYALCTPSHPLSLWGTDEDGGHVERRGVESSFGVWGRLTVEPCFSRPANSRAEPSSRWRSSSSTATTASCTSIS